MLATPKTGRYLWPASISLFVLGRVVTKIGYNQTRVCWRTACPFGASDSVSLGPHKISFSPNTDCFHLPVCNRRLQCGLAVP